MSLRTSLSRILSRIRPMRGGLRADGESELSAGQPPRAILLVDDDPFVRRALTRQFNSLGYSQVLEASDGHEAEQCMDTDGPFAAIVIDLLMPGNDGVQFMRTLADRQDKTALILISGVDGKTLKTAESTARQRGLHVLGILEKPVQTQRIRDLLADNPGEFAPTTTTPPPEITREMLESAIANREFSLNFQPKTECWTGRPVAVEVLLRWRTLDGLIIGPMDFVPPLENLNLIEELTYQIFDRALEQLAQWQEAGIAPNMGINLSANSLQDDALPDRMLELTNKHGIDPASITFELTESTFISNMSNAMDSMARLRLKGFRLAIDDFGTGYATFAQLKLMPFNELKIDRSFVMNIETDAEARAIVESCIDLARKFELSCVAEGVEDERTATRLQDLGVDLVQGYWISAPLPADELTTWWKARLASPDQDAPPHT